MRQQGIDESMGIRTERQAEEGAVGSQLVAASLRSSGVGVTESSLTTGTRADRGSTTGSLAGDEFIETDTGWRYRWTGTAWTFVSGMYAASDAARTALTLTTEDNGAWFFNTATDEDMGLWQVVSGSWVKRFPGGSIDLATSYKVAGVAVVKAQGAAIADASGGATVDTEARAAINALLAHFRTWGAIDT